MCCIHYTITLVAFIYKHGTWNVEAYKSGEVCIDSLRQIYFREVELLIFVEARAFGYRAHRWYSYMITRNGNSYI